MNKILSIIIPSYNMEKLISKCLSSLLVSPENLDKLEILVINDGSKDNTSNIAHQFENNYSTSIKVIDKKNGNYGSTINKGLEIATGKYVKILDSDDSFNTENLDSFIPFLSAIDCDAVLSDTIFVNEESDILKKITFNYNSEIFSISDFPTNFPQTFCMHCLTYRTEILKNINYFQTEKISYTDQEWIFIPMGFVNSICYFPKTIYQYLVGRDGQTISTKAHEKNIMHELIVTKKMLDDFLSREKLIDENHKKFLIIKYLDRCYFTYRYFIIDFNKSIDKKEFVNFDKFLKANLPEVYYELENYFYDENLKIKFIKIWHKAPSFFKLNFLLFKILNKFRPGIIYD